MATLLTVTAVLFSSAFVKTLFAKVVFDPDQLVSVEVRLDRARYKKAEQISTYAQRTLQTIEEMPGVERASICSPGIGANWHMSRNVQWIDRLKLSIDPDDGPQTVAKEPGTRLLSMRPQFPAKNLNPLARQKAALETPVWPGYRNPIPPGRFV